jgi:VanZ family protein
MRRLASWLPPVVWMGIILWLSSGSWSAEETGSLLVPVLRWLPWATPAQITALHFAIRKLAHVAEYAILALLWFRALAREGVSPRRAAWLAFATSVAWASLDELHQSLVPSRTASAVDVGIDTASAAAAVALARGDWRRVADTLTTALLWVTAMGGLVVLVVNALAGVHAPSLWLTTPAAAGWLALRWNARRIKNRAT